MLGIKQKKAISFAVVLIVLLGLSVYLILRFRKQSQYIQEIRQTSYTEITNNSQWPLQHNNNQLNNYQLRLVLDEEFQLDSFEYQGLLVRAWSLGSYLDSENNLQRIAVPRVWYNPKLQKVFFLATAAAMDAPKYTDLFLVNILNTLREANTNKQNLVAAYFIPNDLDSDQSLEGFFDSLQSTTLPDSFLLTGSPEDLPRAPKVGAFMPATQLTFDLDK